MISRTRDLERCTVQPGRRDCALEQQSSCTALDGESLFLSAFLGLQMAFMHHFFAYHADQSCNLSILMCVLDLQIAGCDARHPPIRHIKPVTRSENGQCQAVPDSAQ